MAYRMGDPGLSGRCFRNDRGLHQRCAATGAELFPHQKGGDRWWCSCECHGTRSRTGSQVDRRRYDAWKADYDRLVGTAEGVT
jgi:hypothetical protein